MDNKFGEVVAKLCLDHYKSLPKTGKPQPGKEWTLLAGVIKCTDIGQEYKLEVVSLATGSKCVGPTKMSKTGEILNDSHAEVLARRGFLRYLYGKIQELYNSGASDILESLPNNKCRIKEGINFHMFTSYTPCGDASIFPKEITEPSSETDTSICEAVLRPSSQDQIKELPCNLVKYHEPISDDIPVDIKLTDITKKPLISSSNTKIDGTGQNLEDLNSVVVGNNPSIHNKDKYQENTLKRKMNADESFNSDRVVKKQLKTEQIMHPCERINNDTNKVDKEMDIYRTGAKCVKGAKQDNYGKGDDYHVTGAFRIKPGRGERTVSMSCSDKIARWNVVGCQGALLSHFLDHPIYLTSVTTGRCPYSEEAMRRALVDRNAAVINRFPHGYTLNSPTFYRSQSLFDDGKQAVMDRNRQCGQEQKVVPCSSAIAWWKQEPALSVPDVTTLGRKHGVVAKDWHRPLSRSGLCSKTLFDVFMTLKENIKTENLPETLRDGSFKTYRDYKLAASSYQKAWQQLQNAYGTWEHKPPGYLDFS